MGDNQYLGSSNSGLGGRVIMRVTYYDGKIHNVEIIQHHESAEIGLVAVDELPKEIAEKIRPKLIRLPVHRPQVGPLWKQLRMQSRV